MGKTSGVPPGGLPPAGKPTEKPEGEPEKKYSIGAPDAREATKIQDATGNYKKSLEELNKAAENEKGPKLRKRAQKGSSDADAKTSKKARNVAKQII